jgi:hypothetical protein
MKELDPLFDDVLENERRAEAEEKLRVPTRPSPRLSSQTTRRMATPAVTSTQKTRLSELPPRLGPVRPELSKPSRYGTSSASAVVGTHRAHRSSELPGFCQLRDGARDDGARGAEPNTDGARPPRADLHGRHVRRQGRRRWPGSCLRLGSARVRERRDRAPGRGSRGRLAAQAAALLGVRCAVQERRRPRAPRPLEHPTGTMSTRRTRVRSPFRRARGPA